MRVRFSKRLLPGNFKNFYKSQQHWSVHRSIKQRPLHRSECSQNKVLPEGKRVAAKGSQWWGRSRSDSFLQDRASQTELSIESTGDLVKMQPLVCLGEAWEPVFLTGSQMMQVRRWSQEPLFATLSGQGRDETPHHIPLPRWEAIFVGWGLRGIIPSWVELSTPSQANTFQLLLAWVRKQTYSNFMVYENVSLIYIKTGSGVDCLILGGRELGEPTVVHSLKGILNTT